MPVQFSDAIRNAQADAIESAVGTAPVFELFAGSLPANCAAADAGTKLASGSAPSDWMTAASAGAKSLTSAFTLTGLAAAGGGTVATYFRIKNTAGTVCHHQGTAGGLVAIPTTATTASGNAVLTFAATTGISVGMRVSGTGVAAGSRVVAVTGTTVTLDNVTTGVASGATVTFQHDATLDNASIANGQTVNVTAYNYTQGNA